MKQRKEFTGVVISTRMKDTVVVEVIRLSKHPMYRKTIKRTKHFVAHVTDMELAVDDKVIIAETKPISKTKHFIVISKLTK